MSSSSSSECDCGECCYYPCNGRSYNPGYGGTPFYPTMGQPLVYYTQVQQPQIRRQRSRDNTKRNPNCFVKAFRWYTQELVPPPHRSSQGINRNINGFATWLDSKYDEFLKEGHHDRSMLHLKLKQTSVLKADTIPKNAEIEGYSTNTAKKFGRIRSPWKKRRRQRSIEGGDMLVKSSRSFEYILRPKDLLRPTSESNQVSPTTNYNPSNTTIIKHANRSQSLANVRQNNDNKAPPDVIVVHEGSKMRKRTEQQQANADKPETKASKSGIFNWVRSDVACQCPEESIINAETGTQYESNSLLVVESLSKYFSPTKAQKRKPFKKVHKEYYYDSCECSIEHVLKVDANSQYQQPFNNDVEPQTIVEHKSQNQKTTLIRPTKTVKSTDNIKKADCYVSRKNLEIQTRDVESYKVYKNYGVQTSDCSIRLEKNSMGYPLFMKIMYADKLKVENKGRPIK